MSRLILFRSLPSLSRQLPSSFSAYDSFVSQFNGYDYALPTTTQEQRIFDGVELSLSQFEQLSLFLPKFCHDHNLRISCRLKPNIIMNLNDNLDNGAIMKKEEELESMLHRLSRALSVLPESLVVNHVVMSHSIQQQRNKNTYNDDFDKSIENLTNYFYRILPICARFLEQHPYIGRFPGMHNAHGKPMDTHVLGICHELHQNNKNSNNDDDDALEWKMLENLIDVLPPTRLSISSSNFDFASYKDQTYSSELVEHTDHVSFSQTKCILENLSSIPSKSKKQSSNIWKDTWKWQRQIGAEEVYATICDYQNNCAVENIENNNTLKKQEENFQKISKELKTSFKSLEEC